MILFKDRLTFLGLDYRDQQIFIDFGYGYGPSI